MGGVMASKERTEGTLSSTLSNSSTRRRTGRTINRSSISSSGKGMGQGRPLRSFSSMSSTFLHFFAFFVSFPLLFLSITVLGSE